MVNRKLRMLLLSTAFLTAPLWKVKAFDWLPVGDSVSADGFALTNGVYEEGDRIINTGQTPGEERFVRSFSKLSVSKQQKQTTSSGFRVPNMQAFSRGGEVPSVFNTQFEATAADSTLNITAHLNGDSSAPVAALKIDGDITLTAHEADMVVNINSDVQIVPYADPTGNAFGQGGSFTGTGHSQIYFDVDAGRKITVNLDHNLEFKGRTLGAPSSRGMRRDGSVVIGHGAGTRGGEENGPVVPADMVLTFKGRGQTIFKMADGTAIKFSGDIDGSNSVDVLDGNSFTGFSNNAAGTKVFITMEQTQADIANGLNKVEFQRKDLGDATNPNSNLRDLILVGNNSIITFVGTDNTGRAHEADANVGNFASVGFDPSNNGSGRMVLFILGAYTFGFDEGFPEGTPEFSQVVRKFPFNEGAVVVAGHHVAGYTPEEIRTTLNYSVPAGGQATMRVIDNLIYNNRNAAVPFAPTANNRNGLLVINDAQSVTKHGSDPYLDFFHHSGNGGEESYNYYSYYRGFNRSLKNHMQKHAFSKQVSRAEEGPSQLFGFFWSYSWGVNRPTNNRNVRDGFVLGVNGALDVYPNTFFDYVAGSVNQVDLLAENDYQAFADPKGDKVDSLSVLKKKNPAALVVDGLDQLLFSNGISAFQAADPAVVAQPIHAQINLRGDGAAFFRASGSSKENVGYIFNFWRFIFPVVGAGEGEEGGAVISPLDDASLNYNEALLLGEGTFDGYKLSSNDDTREKGEGEHVVEVEGPLSVNGFASTSVIDPLTGQPRNYATGSVFANAGSLQMLSTEVDGRAFEVAARPLSAGQIVRRYNSPALFFNNNAMFMNSILAHNDLSKMVDGSPMSSDPAVVGGERFAFADKLFTFDGLDRDRYRLPEIQLFNASIDLHESMNASGVRFVVKDIPAALGGANVSGQAGNNSSVMRFFDHGSVDNDFRGFGRVFMLGSFNNQMADESTNWVTESAYVNLFKHNALSTNPLDPSASMALSLQNGNEFPADVAQSSFDKLRAQHLFLMSGMEKGATNMALGWSTPFGVTNDAFPYDNTFYANPAVVESPDNATQFTVDAFITSPATLSINGSYVNFGGFDKDGKSVKGPLTRADNQGIIYVRHGGNLTIGDNTVAGSTSIPAQAVLDTTVGQKVRNDYDDNGTLRVRQLTGIINLPHDQATFMPGAAIQMYGFTNEVLDERASETSGFMRVSVENVARSKGDRSGGANLEISWFNREGDNQVFNAQANAAKSASAAKALAKNAKAKVQTRATEGINAPEAKPARLLYIGSNDDINQLAVAGATLSDPFVFDISGDIANPSFGRVREFVTIKRALDMPTDHMSGEGPHAKLFVELGGRAGLGSRNYNERSLNAWNILGKDFVQVYALGDGVIDVNNNLIIADKDAIVATDEFANFDQDQRLTFFAENEYEIRIPAGVELDLSSFGQSNALQTIAFAGKAKLVVEPGATIRFPQPSQNGPGLALLFTDDSQLIFEGAINPEVFTTAFADSAAANVERIKLIGNVQIRGNKNGKIQVLGSVLVGVQSDLQTPVTNVSISLQRDSQFNIGTSTLAGGAFEVGNPAPVVGGLVNFSLVNFKGNPIIHIDREGFLGLGAGVINKHDNPNGNAQRSNNPVLDANGLAVLDGNGFPQFNPEQSLTTGWQVQPLNNVGTITIQLRSGSFEHNNIVDGSDDAAALIAVGPAAAYNFSLSGPADVDVRGGGNMMLVPAGVGVVRANVWDFASLNADGTQYSILPSGPLLIDRGSTTDLINVPAFGNGGKAFTFTAQADFFGLLAFKSTSAQESLKVDVGRGGLGSGTLVAGFVNANVNVNDIYPAATNKIVRVTNPGVLPPARLEQGLGTGTLTAQADGVIDPTTFNPLL